MALIAALQAEAGHLRPAFGLRLAFPMCRESITQSRPCLRAGSVPLRMSAPMACRVIPSALAASCVVRSAILLGISLRGGYQFCG